MVYVIDGVAYAGHKPQGPEYKREPTKFSHSGSLDLENMRLHLYVCAACPWAHRALLTRNLSETLRKSISVSAVSPFRDDAIGWEFLSKDNEEKVKQFTKLPVTVDKSPLNAKSLLDVYLSADPNYTGNITTPTLYDANSNKIISNDSFGIMRHFVETVPDELGHLYKDPEAIDCEGRQIDEELAKRVYMCGLAKEQRPYEESLERVFAELDRLESLLSDKRSYLLGDDMSLADLQLTSCLVRFDPVYFSLFKCYTRRISSYPFLSAYLRRITKEIGSEAMSLDLDQIIHHYFTNFLSANPTGVVPIGYRKDFLDGGKEDYTGLDTSENTSAKNVGTDQDQTNAEERRAKGEYVRGVSAYRHWLGGEDFPLEPDRYVLFVANNCPWCHRTLVARALHPEVEKMVQVSTMFYRRGEDGWRYLPTEESELKSFEMDRPDLLEGVDKSDPTGNDFKCAKDIYKLSDPTSTEKSVPILFDTKTNRVVSNESADIVKMMVSAAKASPDAATQEKIDKINDRVYPEVNNGAYRAGFSSDQESYEVAATEYFRALRWLDGILSKSKYLATDDYPTEADIRLFPTMYRHDPVYFSRMKVNVAMVKDYPNLNRWLLDMKSREAIQRASRLDHCIAGYFGRTGNNLVPFVGLDHDGIQEY